MAQKPGIGGLLASDTNPFRTDAFNSGHFVPTHQKSGSIQKKWLD